MQVTFFSKVVWSGQKILTKVKEEKKPYLHRAGKYLLKVARNNIKASAELKDVKFTNYWGKEEERKTWASKAKKGHSPRDHAGWKNSFRYAVDEMAEVVDIGAIRGKHHIAPLHEFGGMGDVRYIQYDWQGKLHEFHKSHLFPKRPTMIPALRRSAKYISSFWKGVIVNI